MGIVRNDLPANQVTYRISKVTLRFKPQALSKAFALDCIFVLEWIMQLLPPYAAQISNGM